MAKKQKKSKLKFEKIRLESHEEKKNKENGIKKSF